MPVPAGAVSTTEPPWQKVVGPPAVSVAVGVPLMATVAVAVLAEQPPEAGTVLVTVYVPGVDVDGVMAPVAASRVRPVVELNVPAVAPVARAGVTAEVFDVQKFEVLA